MEEVISNLKDQISQVEQKITQNEELRSSESSEEMKNLINEEIANLNQQKQALEESLNELENNSNTVSNDDDPSTHVNKNVAIFEVRAGTGGQEASIFAADLYRMYVRYIEKSNKFKYEIISRSDSEVGGIKTIVFRVKGQDAFKMFVNESGVHRVQRVPETESSGRIHTSTATVAVLPQLKKVHIEIRPDELSYDFYHSSGSGGQNVNKVSTAVRLTHLPTGIVVECQQERTQGRNRELALELLKSRLYQMMMEQRVKNIIDLRSEQVGSGERSEKIRTYNFPQDRITDHRLQKNWHNLPSIMNGDIEEILELSSSIEI